jgi:regulatory protein
MEALDKTYKDAVAKMARLCSRSEQCSFDIRKKLEAMELDKDVVDDVMAVLINENYLNDERYVKAYVADKFKFNKWGKIKIRYYLRMKCMPDALISSALEDIDEEKYKKMLVKTMKDKAKTIKNKDKYQKMGSIIRFTQNRGFEPELIHRYMNQVLE